MFAETPDWFPPFYQPVFSGNWFHLLWFWLFMVFIAFKRAAG
jgi:hypothetical protein